MKPIPLNTVPRFSTHRGDITEGCGGVHFWKGCLRQEEQPCRDLQAEHAYLLEETSTWCGRGAETGEI